MDNIENTNEYSQRKAIYVSGPISGVDDAKSVFTKQCQELADTKYPAGQWMIVNPVDGGEIALNIRKSMFEKKGEEYDPTPQQTEAFLMGLDIETLMLCDGIYMMPGWRRSYGCIMEYVAALKVKHQFNPEFVIDGVELSEQLIVND